MEVRRLNQQEVLPALHLVWRVFAQDVAPTYSPEGVEQFREYIRYEQINRKYQAQELILFGAFEETALRGVLAVGADGHISLLFVEKEFQRRGIGRMLFQALYASCIQELGVRKLTVNAAPAAVPFYEKLGMKAEGEPRQEQGIAYVPMAIYVIAGFSQPEKKRSKGVIIAAVVGGILLLALIFAGGAFLIRNIYHEMQDSFQGPNTWNGPEPDYGYDDGYTDPWGDYGDGGYGFGDGYDSDADSTGLAGLPVYEAEEKSYEITDEVYSFSDDEKQSTIIEFHVTYPKLEGLDKETGEKVNEAIRACAMKTVDEIYTNPSEEIKEKVLGEDLPILASYVEYTVCYAGKDFLSVAFEDYSYQGSQDSYDLNLRTLNISLKDGTVYQADDIVKIDETFVEEWLEIMRQEADNDAFLSELTPEELEKSLKGDSLDGVYRTVFVVDADGIEIGYDLNYEKNDSHDLGYIWVTAPFTFEEAQQYASDSGFWDLLDR